MNDLTWSELMAVSLIGKPVWSVEKRRWYLVCDSAMMHEDWLEIVDSDGKIHHLIEHDLKDYKLVKQKDTMTRLKEVLREVRGEA